MGTVLVTGCGSGIGLHTAVAAARAGHHVYAGLRDLSSGGDLRRSVAGLSVTPVQLDITKPEERETVVRQIVSERGGLDALINNAGVTLGGFLEQVEEAEVRRVFEVNVFGTWAMTRICLPYLRNRLGAKVIFVSSMAGRSAFPALGVYAGSKHALEGFGEAWRHELRLFGVYVAIVEPGGFRTEILGRNRRLTIHAGDTSGPYGGLMLRLDAFFRKHIDPIAHDPVLVADLVVRILARRRPALRYPVGADARIRAVVARLVPFRIVERVLSRVVSRALRESA